MLSIQHFWNILLHYIQVEKLTVVNILGSLQCRLHFGFGEFNDNKAHLTSSNCFQKMQCMVLNVLDIALHLLLESPLQVLETERRRSLSWQIMPFYNLFLYSYLIYSSKSKSSEDFWLLDISPTNQYFKYLFRYFLSQFRYFISGIQSCNNIKSKKKASNF